ncbi:MAG: hypothetical protein R3C56_38255 [Pirellulaceae bacterium]
MSSKPSCPPLKHLAKYAKGTLLEEAQELLLLHVNSCDHCKETIQTLRDVEAQTSQPAIQSEPQVPTPSGGTTIVTEHAARNTRDSGPARFAERT